MNLESKNFGYLGPTWAYIDRTIIFGNFVVIMFFMGRDKPQSLKN